MYCLFFIVDQVVSILRYVIVLYFFGKIQVSSNKLRNIIVSVGWLIAIPIVFFLYYRHSEYLLIVGNAIFLSCIFGNSKKRVLKVYIPMYVMFSFIDELGAMGMGLLFHFNPLLVTEQKGEILDAGIIVCSCILLMIIQAKIRDKEKIIEIIDSVQKVEYILFCVTLTCFNLLMSAITFCMFSDNSVQLWSQYRSFIIVISVASVFFVTILVGDMIMMSGRRKAQNDIIEAYEKMNSMQKRYYQMINEKNDEIRQFRHDFHHHINYINQQMKNGDYEKVNSYLISLMGVSEHMKYKKNIFSGNTVIDAIICATVMEQESGIIKFDYVGKIEQNIGIQDIDLITLLSNALENAVEACMQCDSDKEIEMRVERYKENIRFIIKNTFVENDANRNIIRFTTKNNKEEHGYGRQNIMRIVEKYDGVIEEKIIENRYCLVIQLNQK